MTRSERNALWTRAMRMNDQIAWILEWAQRMDNSQRFLAALGVGTGLGDCLDGNSVWPALTAYVAVYLALRVLTSLFVQWAKWGIRVQRNALVVIDEYDKEHGHDH